MSPNRIIDVSTLQQFTAVQVLLDGGAVGGPVVVPQCAQLALRWLGEDGKTFHNVLYGRYTGAFNGTQAQANAITTALTTGASWTALAAFLPTTTAFGGIDLRDVNSAFQPLIQSNAPGAFGTSASPSLPDEVALVVTLRTALSGRQNRGRAYIPGWATNALGAGNVAAAAAVTALGNWANTIPSAFSAQGYTLVIGQKHRKAYTGITGVSHPDRPANSVPVTSLVVRDNHWDSQRRRGLK